MTLDNLLSKLASIYLRKILKQSPENIISIRFKTDIIYKNVLDQIKTKSVDMALGSDVAIP